LEAKAIFVPSGDQTGSESSRVFVVSRVSPLPSAFATMISLPAPENDFA
jgi:hypothetical protein